MLVTPPELNLRHLRAVPAIIDSGSMSAAAQIVSLSQPALTQGISKLERQLGLPLFDRRSDGLSPTHAGLLLAGRVRAAFQHMGADIRSGRRGFARPELLMTATQLHAFRALADAGSFVTASALTGITQPALHRAVRDLEQLHGVPLATRAGRGLAITAVGRKLARGMRLATSEIAAAINELSPDPGAGARITIGAMPLCRAILLPSAIAKLMREVPRATIDVREGSWRELIEPLRDGTLDMAIGALREIAPAGLVQEYLFEDQLVVVARAGHPLAVHPAPTLADYRRYGWIIGHPETPLRAHWTAMFGGGSLPEASIECGSAMVIRGLLRESDLLTLLSPDQVQLEIDTGILAAIGRPGPRGRRAIGITTRESWRPTPAQNRFLQLLRQSRAAGKVQEVE